jgi:glutamate dehydrogenase/leucine dehydrogenase
MLVREHLCRSCPSSVFLLASIAAKYLVSGVCPFTSERRPSFQIGRNVWIQIMRGGKMARFQDKVILISGTGGGLGRVAAMAFAKEGARVLGCDVVAEGYRSNR